MFRHIVLFKLHDTTSPNQRDEAVRLLRGLGKNSNLLEWNVELSTDTRKGIIIVENGLFQDENAYKTFHTSNEHNEAGDYMKQISDWWIADYSE